MQLQIADSTQRLIYAASQSVASGSTASFVIPSGVLLAGGSYTFEVGADDGSGTAWSSWLGLSVYQATGPITQGYLGQHYQSGQVLSLITTSQLANQPACTGSVTGCLLINMAMDPYKADTLNFELAGYTSATNDDAGTLDGYGNLSLAHVYGYNLPYADNVHSCDALGQWCYQVGQTSGTVGNLYRIHYSNGVVLSEEEVWAPSNGCTGAIEVVSDGSGNAFFVANCSTTYAQRIYEYKPDHSLTLISDEASGTTRSAGTPVSSFQFDNIMALAFDPAGNLLVSEGNYGDLWMVTGQGDMAPPIPDAQTYGSCGGAGGLAVNPSTCHADPVNTATGSFTHTDTDVSMASFGIPFAWSRSYTSADGTDGPMGVGWTFPYNESVSLSGSVATVRSGSGQQSQFTYNGVEYLPNAGVHGVLVKNSDGTWTLTQYDQTRTKFDSTGKLIAITDRNGAGVTLSYSSGNLATITDASGRVVTVTMNGTHIGSVSLPDGRNVSYQYTGNLLTGVTDPRGKTTTYGYDSSNRLTTITDPLGHVVVTNTYGADGRVSKQVDAMGQASTFSFDASTGISTMTDAAGGVWKDTYSGNRLVSTTDPLGHTTSYRYDNNQDLIATTDPNGAEVDRVYDANGNLVEQDQPVESSTTITSTWSYDTLNDLLRSVDGRGEVTRYSYDSVGNLTSKTTPDGATITYTRDTTHPDLVTAITDGRGLKTSYGYDAAGNPTSTTSPSGNVTTRGFDSTGRLTSMVDPRGNVAGATPATYQTTYAYDAANHVTQVTHPLGDVTKYSYDNAGNLATVTDALGRVTTYTYNAANEVTSRAAPAGTSTWAYTPRGQVSQLTTADGATTTYGYDLARQLTSTVAPDGNVSGGTPSNFTTTFVYDAAGHRTKVTDPLGHATSYAYDEAGRVTSRTAPGGGVTKYAYDGDNNVVTRTDPLGNATTYSYDPMNRLAKVTDPLTHATSYTYDLDGNQISRTDANGHVTTWTYNSDNQLATQIAPSQQGATSPQQTLYGYDPAGNQTSITNPAGGVTKYAFDADSQVTSVTDPMGHTKTFGRDGLGRITTVTDATGGKTTYTYDNSGQVATLTTPAGHVTTNTHDAAGRLLSNVDALGHKWTYTYDANGNQLTSIDPIANAANNPALGTVTNTYDAANELTGTTYSDSTPAVSYLYDADGNRTQMTDASTSGCLIKTAANCAAIQAYTYDADGQLTKVTRNGKNFTYTYDAAGNILTRAIPGGSTTTYTYDPANQMATASIGSSKSSYTWNADSELSGINFASGANEALTYNPNQQLMSVTLTSGTSTLSALSYQRNADGQPTSQTLNGAVTNYTYDPRGELTSQCPTITVCTNYTYDADGNRATQADSTGTTTYSYNNADQLTSATLGSTSTTYTNDADGRQTAAGSTTYGYNLAQEMATSTAGGKTYTYTHDGDGNLSTASTKSGLSTTTTTYTWDGNNPIPQLASVAGSSTQYLYYGVGLLSETAPAALLGSPTDSYITTDATGSINAISSSTGALQRTIAYDAFGNITTNTAVGGATVTTPLTFDGQLQNTSTGTLDFHARNYDPSTGRFTQTDPLAPAVGTNTLSPYVFANNQPTLLTDPTGMRSDEPSFGSCLGAAAYGAVNTALFGIPGRIAQNLFGDNPSNGMNPICEGLGSYIGGVGALATGDLAGLSALDSVSTLNDVGYIGDLGLQPAKAGTAGADDVLNGVRLRAQLSGQEIAGGHAFEKHILDLGEFPGIRTRAQFASLIEDVVLNGEMRALGGGRTAFWRDGTVVIRNPRAPDGGTAFQPTDGYDYFLNQLH